MTLPACRRCGRTRNIKPNCKGYVCVAQRRCRHCLASMCGRVGRGLCRICWDDSEIRKQYEVVAEFGGKKAGVMGGGPATVTLREFTASERADCTKLACTIRNGLLKAMAGAGLVREPKYEGESDYTEEFSVAACEIAERLMRLMRRAGVPDDVSEAEIEAVRGGVE